MTQAPLAAPDVLDFGRTILLDSGANQPEGKDDAAETFIRYLASQRTGAYPARCSPLSCLAIPAC